MLGSFWWKDILKLLSTFQKFVKCKAGIGDTIRLWKDPWSQLPFQQQFPELYSFTNNAEITLHNAIHSENRENLFHRPLSSVAHQQFIEMQDIINNLPVVNQKDSWTYTWPSPSYSSMKMYNCLIGHNNNHFIFKILWKASNLLRHKIFFWLLLYDRVNTRNLLRRKSMFLESYDCVLCNDKAEETSLHLF